MITDKIILTPQSLRDIQMAPMWVTGWGGGPI